MSYIYVIILINVKFKCLLSPHVEIPRPPADDEVEESPLSARPKLDGSAVWKSIKDDKRLLELRECLYKKIGGPTRPSATVLALLCITCAGLGAMFLLLIFYGFGPGTFFSESSTGTAAGDTSDNNTALVVQCVCSAKPSEVITQLTIVMLVILSAGTSAFFMYFYDQTARAVHAATVVVDGCQEVLSDREHAINELIAGQKTDAICMRYLERMREMQERQETEKE